MTEQDPREGLIRFCEEFWRSLRSGAADELSRRLHDDFVAAGHPVEGTRASETPISPSAASSSALPAGVAELGRRLGEGSGLTNVVHRVEGAQILGALGIVQTFWMAEEGLGEDGAGRFISGRAVLTCRRDTDRWMLAGWLGTPGPHRTRTAEERLADVQAIREQILRVFEAYRQKNEAILRRTHTAEWRGFALSSPSIGRGIEAYMRAAKSAMASVQFEEYRILELDAVFYGDIAIVPYVAAVAGKTAQGKAEESRLRVIDVYLREPAGWNQIASNVSLHPGDFRTR